MKTHSTHSESNDFGYYSLCYHYVRNATQESIVPDLLGATEEDFETHLATFRREYEFIGLDTALEYSYSDKVFFDRKPGLLITFDDGLSDHYRAAIILANAGVQAVFFIPTCIFTDYMPANPIIIHYVLSLYRIKGLLHAYNEMLDELILDKEKYMVQYRHGAPWEVIKNFKQMINYTLDHVTARKILLGIYKKTLKRDFKDPLSLMHVTESQVKEMISMGHSIGVHSHTHPSIASAYLTKNQFITEVKKPKEILESLFGCVVESLSYPFGGVKDCFTPEQLQAEETSFKLAFTVNEILNTKKVNPLALGRYMPHSTDTAESIMTKLQTLG